MCRVHLGHVTSQLPGFSEDLQEALRCWRTGLNSQAASLDVIGRWYGQSGVVMGLLYTSSDCYLSIFYGIHVNEPLSAYVSLVPAFNYVGCVWKFYASLAYWGLPCGSYEEPLGGKFCYNGSFSQGFNEFHGSSLLDLMCCYSSSDIPDLGVLVVSGFGASKQDFEGCRMLIMGEHFWCSGYEVLLCWFCDAVAGLQGSVITNFYDMGDLPFRSMFFIHWDIIAFEALGLVSFSFNRLEGVTLLGLAKFSGCICGINQLKEKPWKLEGVAILPAIATLDKQGWCLGPTQTEHLIAVVV
ncbi:hypothetical protein TIFTF001_005270 [Ficus carica]|uniref:Uncharacterized protein n=1 Tax=Ficus carica TaxID=3494 RepID=A0AA88CYE7_FICCA|nr:hypothetical protein TIFTF001_005270 [Ficus carica]